MAFVRSILWVPMVFGIIMGGLAIAKLVANFTGEEFVAVPGQIMDAYVRLANALSYYALEWPFGIRLNPWMRDFGVAWIVFCASNIRLILATANYKYNPTFSEERDYFLRNLLRHLFGINGNIITSAILLTILGPFGSLRTVIELNNQIRINKKRKLKIDDPYLDQHIDVATKTRNVLIGIVFANPIIAAGLLWWNAAEIERLTAGIG